MALGRKIKTVFLTLSLTVSVSPEATVCGRDSLLHCSSYPSLVWCSDSCLHPSVWKRCWLREKENMRVRDTVWESVYSEKENTKTLEKHKKTMMERKILLQCKRPVPSSVWTAPVQCYWPMRLCEGIRRLRSAQLIGPLLLVNTHRASLSKVLGCTLHKCVYARSSMPMTSPLLWGIT